MTAQIIIPPSGVDGLEITPDEALARAKNELGPEQSALMWRMKECNARERTLTLSWLIGRNPQLVAEAFCAVVDA